MWSHFVTFAGIRLSMDTNYTQAVWRERRRDGSVKSILQCAIMHCAKFTRQSHGGCTAQREGVDPTKGKALEWTKAVAQLPMTPAYKFKISLIPFKGNKRNLPLRPSLKYRCHSVWSFPKMKLLLDILPKSHTSDFVEITYTCVFSRDG